MMNEPSINKEEQFSFKDRKQLIDGLLDMYNDYKFLYEFFQDEHYKRVMDLILKNIRRIAP